MLDAFGDVNAVSGATIKRDTYEDNYAFMINNFGLGQPFFFQNLGIRRGTRSA